MTSANINGKEMLFLKLYLGVLFSLKVDNSFLYITIIP